MKSITEKIGKHYKESHEPFVSEPLDKRSLYSVSRYFEELLTKDNIIGYVEQYSWKPNVITNVFDLDISFIDIKEMKKINAKYSRHGCEVIIKQDFLEHLNEGIRTRLTISSLY